MSRDGTSGQAKPLRVALGLAVAFVLSLLVTAGAKGCRDLDTVRQREALLEQRIGSTEAEIERLEHGLELLQDDPTTLERMAREEGMVRPNDWVIVLPPE